MRRSTSGIPALCRCCDPIRFVAIAPIRPMQLPPIELTNEIFDRDIKWLDEIDEKLPRFSDSPAASRTPLNASEPRLNAFIQRQLRKPHKAQADQDKIDLLLVQYFALCAPAGLSSR